MIFVGDFTSFDCYFLLRVIRWFYFYLLLIIVFGSTYWTDPEVTSAAITFSVKLTDLPPSTPTYGRYESVGNLSLSSNKAANSRKQELYLIRFLPFYNKLWSRLFEFFSVDSSSCNRTCNDCLKKLKNFYKCDLSSWDRIVATWNSLLSSYVTMYERVKSALAAFLFDRY